MSLQNISIPDDAIAALKNGNKVEAARIIRNESWVTLKQASNAADAFLEAHPDIKARYLDQQDKNWNGFVYFVALLSVAVIIANLFQ